MNFDWSIMGGDFPYDNCRPLGHGGYGAVYVANDRKTNKKRAIKLIRIPKEDHREKGGLGAAPERLVKSELQIMERLKKEKHPHLVKLHQVFRVGERLLALVMEYCDEGDLSGFIKRAKDENIPPETKKKLFQDLVLGMYHLKNRLRVVHRDLKPENLLLKKKGTELVLKIADFGLAKELADGQEVMKSVLGTFGYVAPEVGSYGFYDSKADLWSAGAILYELLSGKKVRSGKKKLPTIKEGNFIVPEETRGTMETLYPKAMGLVEGLLRALPKERMGWDEFFDHPWIDLKSRTKVEFDGRDWSGDLSPYRFLALLAGGNAEVYKAKEKNTERTVVIKMVKKKNLRPKELEIMDWLLKNPHPSIVKVYRVHKGSEGQIFFVMECCDQGDLYHYLNENGELNEEMTKGLMQDLARGLDFLRSKNIFHRDLKPSNFLLKMGKGGKLRLKLADFGDATHVENDYESFRSFVGTGPYLAPEKTGTYSASSDLWSIGITMWQMLLNSLPFGKGQWGEVMERIETEELDFRKLRGKVSDSCLDLLERLLQKDPRRRISWEEFFVHPWLDLPREQNEVVEALEIVENLIKLSKRCNNDIMSFSLHMESLSILDALLPRDEEGKEGGEGGGGGGDPSRSGDFSHVRQPFKTKPFKSDSSSSKPPSSNRPPRPSVFPSPDIEAQFHSTFEIIFKEALKLGQEIKYRATKIPPVTEIIYEQVVELGKRAAHNESLGEDVVGEYEFCLVLLRVLEERVGGGEGKELVKGLKENFGVRYEGVKEKRK